MVVNQIPIFKLWDKVERPKFMKIMSRNVRILSVGWFGISLIV